MHSIELVGSGDLEDLLGLMRAYCDFYEAAPSDEALLALAHRLIADPDGAGIQLIARDARSQAGGFATLVWTYDTLEGGHVGVMNDLYVVPGERRAGLGMRLIEACIERSLARGAVCMKWETMPENDTAQRLYDRLGGVREETIAYALPLLGR